MWLRSGRRSSERGSRQTIEERTKPPLFLIAESLETSNDIEDSFLEATIKEEDQDRLLAMLRKKALTMDAMDCGQLLAFIKTLLSVRNCLLEKEQERGVEMMQEMARSASTGWR